jgi:hypothetical protein
VDEGDAPAARAGPGGLVDESVAVFTASFERAIEIWDAVTDMVDARPTFGQEPSYGAVGRFRAEELDTDFPERHGNNLGPICILGMGWSQPEHVAVERQGLIQVFDGDADVSDLGRGVGHGASMVKSQADRVGRPACT